ncbi:MAG: hypothetical protein IKA48_01180 [Fibrobacter sp.]|nr:hypothetical protein [Fibrobacter sp.]
MNQKFVNYLQLLESRAPASKKADFHNALELYKSRAAKTEAVHFPFDRSVASAGTKPAQSSYSTRTPGTGIDNAKRTPEMVKADEERAATIRASEENFPTAAKTVTTLAETSPGKVDAWVDCRLKPVIRRAKKADGLGGSEGSKAKYKSDYKTAEKKYRAEDKEAREQEQADRAEALAKAKADEEHKAEEARKAASQKKMDELGSNREYKYSADMPLNATDKDINEHVATARSADLAKAEEADEKMREAEKRWADDGETVEFGNPMSSEEVAKNQAEKKRLADFADSIDFDSLMPDVAAVNIKGLRAAFESVYGDSSGFTDNEIRAICESCYRRSRQK